MDDLRSLTRTFVGVGTIETIFVRPARDEPAVSVGSAETIVGRGLAGDRSAARKSTVAGKRQVTLIQSEHLPLIARWTGRDRLDPALLRRNLVVSGLNLIAARSPFADQVLRLLVGEEVVVEVTGNCAPCSKMESILGPGGYNAMRGHGGVTARIVQGGVVALGATVRVAP